MIWRRTEQEAIAIGTRGLMAATSEEEVVDSVLPYALQISGARAVALVDRASRVIGSEGDRPDEPPATVFDFPVASLQVWTNPYTPYFGREELTLLESLGVLINLALERTRLFTSLEEAQRIAHLGSYEFDLSTGEATWSAEMYRISGVDPGVELTTDAMQSSVHPDDRELTQSATEEARRTGRFEFDYRIVRPDGEVRVVHLRGSAQRDEEGEPIRLTGTVLDVTELRAAERELRLALDREKQARRDVERVNAEMESFVYTVSHDLNSPLVALLGYLEFIEQDHADTLGERGGFYVERMRASATYMRALIRDLLELSRVGRVDERSERVDLELVAAEVAESIRSASPEAGVTIGPLPVVWMNPVRARQLVTNVVQNSVKYGGRADIGITITRVAEEDGMVEVSVRDDGAGIPEEDRRRVFGVFERLRRDDEEGTGIGLAICKKIVTSAGGSIWVAPSELGADIRFTLPLPSPAGEVPA
jgi:PAS domain S-box-containing protein